MCASRSLYLVKSVTSFFFFFFSNPDFYYPGCYGVFFNYYFHLISDSSLQTWEWPIGDNQFRFWTDCLLVWPPEVRLGSSTKPCARFISPYLVIPRERTSRARVHFHKIYIFIQTISFHACLPTCQDPLLKKLYTDCVSWRKQFVCFSKAATKSLASGAGS